MYGIRRIGEEKKPPGASDLDPMPFRVDARQCVPSYAILTRLWWWTDGIVASVKGRTGVTQHAQAPQTMIQLFHRTGNIIVLQQCCEPDGALPGLRQAFVSAQGVADEQALGLRSPLPRQDMCVPRVCVLGSPYPWTSDGRMGARSWLHDCHVVMDRVGKRAGVTA